MVGGLYTAIIFVLVGTNLHRFKRDSSPKRPDLPKTSSNKSPSNSSAKKPFTDVEAENSLSQDDKFGEDSALQMPLLDNSQSNINHETEYVEAIDVTSTGNQKRKYSHSVIKETEYKKHFLNTEQNNILFTGDLRDSYHNDKISTTVVTSGNFTESSKRNQNIRVGLTSEEDIKPKALLEMIGDDEGEPVAV